MEASIMRGSLKAARERDAFWKDRKQKIII